MVDLSLTFDRLKKIASARRRGSRSRPNGSGSGDDHARTRADRFDDIFRSLTFPRLDGERNGRAPERAPVTDEG